MDIKILAELPSKILAGAGIVILILLIVMFGAGRCSKGDPETIVQHDTVKIEKLVQLGGTLNSNTVIKPEKVVKPIPSVTKFKIGDLACAWGKWSGVVDDIVWSSTDESQSVLKYNVQYFNESTQEWELENWYYDSELTPGKCN